MSNPADPQALADQEKRKQHIALLVKITIWSGWILAFSSLAIGSYILNKMHLELVELRRENKELQISTELADERSTMKRKADHTTPPPLSKK